MLFCYAVGDVKVAAIAVEINYVWMATFTVSESVAIRDASAVNQVAVMS